MAIIMIAFAKDYFVVFFYVNKLEGTSFLNSGSYLFVPTMYHLL